MAKVHVSFTLDTKEDRRVVRWLEGLPKREKSKAIREALAAHLGQNGVTLRDIYEAIQELKRAGHGCSYRSAAPNQEPQADIPADVLENLSKLGV